MKILLIAIGVLLLLTLIHTQQIPINLGVINNGEEILINPISLYSKIDYSLDPKLNTDFAVENVDFIIPESQNPVQYVDSIELSKCDFVRGADFRIFELEDIGDYKSLNLFLCVI